jgi:hemolysin D
MSEAKMLPKGGQASAAPSRAGAQTLRAAALHEDWSWCTSGSVVEEPSHWARLATWAVCAMVLLTALYLYWAKLDVVVSAEGRVVLTGKTKQVQAPEGGVIRRIAAVDGARVKRGDVLVELDSTVSAADKQRAERDFQEASVEVARAQSLLAGRGSLATLQVARDVVAHHEALLRARLSEQAARMGALDQEVARRRAESGALLAQVARLKQMEPLARRRFEQRQALVTSGMLSEASLLEARMELMATERELEQTAGRQAELDATLQAAIEQRKVAANDFAARANAELAEASKRRDLAQQELLKAQQRLRQQVIVAPSDGVVQQLSVNTLGGSVQSGQFLMAVAPEGDALELEVQLLNRDVGVVQQGQSAIVKAEAFDFTRYGHIEGEITWVGLDSVTDPRLGLVYPARVRLARTATPRSVEGRNGLLKPGMSATVDIRVGQRRILDTLIGPMLRYRSEALRER